MILYHMGIYGTFDFFEHQEGRGEYSLRGGGLINAWYHCPNAKILYLCDELATIEEDHKEGT